MRCPSCRKKVDEHLQFCPHCATRLPAPGQEGGGNVVTAGTRPTFVGSGEARDHHGKVVGGEAGTPERVISQGDKPTYAGAESAAPCVRLAITRGLLRGKEFKFDEHDTFLFGRCDSCHAALPDDSFVSRHHFILEVNPPEACLRDLGSLNGTYVNRVKYGGREKDETPEEGGQRHYPEVSLNDGDEIHIGQTAFSVQIEGIEAADVKRGSPARQDGAPKIHGYEVERELGHGGLGTVYLARRLSDGILKALKVLQPKVAVSARARARFAREMDVLGKLRHPNIIAFEERGLSGDTFWFAMDYCNGGSVIDLLEREGGKVSLEMAVPIMLQILSALEFAHDRDFVHRDLKPENILLSEQEGKWTARIGDFGLAKSFSKAGLSGMTLTGTHSGTYPFMPVEQLTNFKYVKPVSDVWSVAATFYYILTGCFPRDEKPGQDPMQIILEGDVIPICERGAAIPVPVAEVIDHALANDTKQRYQTAGRFLKAFRQALKAMGSDGAYT